MSYENVNPYSSPQSAVSSAGIASELAPDAMTVELLARTRPWVKFLAILGMIGIALMALVMVFMVYAAATGMDLGEGNDAPPIMLAIIYGVMIVLYVIPIIYMWTYVGEIRRFTVSGQTADLNSALDAQRKFWKFLGGFMAVVLSIYGVIAVIGVLVIIAGVGRGAP